MKITCSGDASLIINAAIQSHAEQWQKITNTEEILMEYKKPFDEKDRLDQFITWSNNWNFGKGRMIIEQGVLSNKVEIYKTLSMIEICFNRYNKQKDKLYEFLTNKYLRYVFERKIAEIFADILEADIRFDTFITKIEYNSYTFGYCPIIRDKFNYLGNPISLKNIAFEDRTKIDQIRNYVIFDFIKGETLLEKVEECVDLETILVTPENASDDKPYHIYTNGWVKEGLEEVFYNRLSNNKDVIDDVKEGRLDLKAALGKEGELIITSWEDVTAILNYKGRIWMQLNINNIYIAKMFTTTSEGHIYETYIASEAGVTIALGEKQVPTGYDTFGTNEYLLFQKNYGHKPYTDYLNIVKEFAISSGDFIQDLKGCSKQVVEESLRYDFKRNAIEDKLLLNGSLILGTTEDLSQEAVKLKVFGGMIILPPNVPIAPGQIKMDLNDHVVSLQQDEADFQRRTSHYNPQLDLSNRPTKDEVSLKGAQFSNQKNSKIPFKLRDYEILFTNILYDLVNEDYDNQIDKDAKKQFFSELEEEFSEFGIKEKDIKKILKEVYAIKLHAVNNDIQSIQQAMPFAQNTNGRTRLIRSFLIALGFSRQDCNIFIEVIDYGHQIEQAAFENAAFYNTSEVVFDTSQDNIGHLQIHFPKIDRVIRGIQSGEDIVAGFHYITNALTNTAKHVEAIKSSIFFKNRYKEFATIQKQFEKTAKQISDIIIKKKEENANKQGGDMQIPPEELAKIKLLEWQMQEKNKRTNWLTAEGAKRKAAEFATKLAMKEKESDTTIEEKKKITDAIVELKQVEAATKMAAA